MVGTYLHYKAVYYASEVQMIPVYKQSYRIRY